MGVPAFNDIRYRLRREIRDDAGTLFTDEALDGIINEAQREYSLYGEVLTGDHSVETNENGIYKAPEDFIRPLSFTDASGLEIEQVSWTFLDERYPDFRKIDGDRPKYICFDLDGFGRFRLFPKVPAGQTAGTLHYVRTAHSDVLEGTNREAVLNHALFQVFYLTGKAGAWEYYRKFREETDAETRSGQTLRNRVKKFGGVYY